MVVREEDPPTMLTLSSDPDRARRELTALAAYLVTFAHVDGHFDPAELRLIRSSLMAVVERRVEATPTRRDAAQRTELLQRFRDYVEQVLSAVNLSVEALMAESVSHEDDQTAYVATQLKARCLEVFEGFEPDAQAALLDTVDELIMADGVAHPAELQLREELLHWLASPDEVELEPIAEPHPVVVHDVGSLFHDASAHPFFESGEAAYSPDPGPTGQLVASDRALIRRVFDELAAQREAGGGALAGHRTVAGLAGRPAFLDGHVYAIPRDPDRRYELTVLGDLHGCYSCLKAALMQSGFLDKVGAYREDPAGHPEPHLILLGDYVDRGHYGIEGVLRTALRLFALMPGHVHLLRGNHEFLVEEAGRIKGGVRPAESVEELRRHAPLELLRDFLQLFEGLPNLLLFDGMIFVHGGIPRDDVFRERYRDLSSLNDPFLRFQMMWSDPSTADVIPVTLQRQSIRFPFGRLQAAAFLERLGCHTLVRGHEMVGEGFRRTYDDERNLLITLFSAGGADNADLPPDSRYRRVSPMALTVTAGPGEPPAIHPWAIDYLPYNDPGLNRFYAGEEELVLE